MMSLKVCRSPIVDRGVKSINMLYDLKDSMSQLLQASDMPKEQSTSSVHVLGRLLMSILRMETVLRASSGFSCSTMQQRLPRGPAIRYVTFATPGARPACSRR
jgi:hypothetical protein